MPVAFGLAYFLDVDGERSEMPDKPSSSVRQFIQGASIIQVAEPERTAAYFRDVLGFNFDFSMDGYSVVWRDDSAIHFATGDTHVQGVVLFQWLVDVDAYYEEVESRGANITREPSDQSYGVRQFSVTDLNGITLNFGEDIE